MYEIRVAVRKTVIYGIFALNGGTYDTELHRYLLVHWTNGFKIGSRPRITVLQIF